MAKKRKTSNLFLGLLLFTLVILGLFVLAILQVPKVASHKTDFFEQMAPLAIDIGEKYDLYPSVILAQAAIESSYGQSELTINYNNYFGIKGNEKNGIKLITNEIYNGKTVEEEHYFRSYSSEYESFKDYGKLITGLDRYREVAEADSPEAAAYALYPAGYSTNPNYGDLIVQIIEENNLKRFDEEIR